ncbi:transcription/translation regulatory transformer protein RfaH [Alphaproteobacteria bacterium]|nr:transcription/translation regulatory transformer protein RfaH [Alphaproteobacteria bacterium]
MSWYVVYTQPMKEALAAQELLQQGFEAFLPQFQKERRHARKVTTVLSPLFPRYLFVKMDLTKDQWRRINGTRGVVQIIANGSKPTPVPQGLIESLQSQRNEQGFLALGSLITFVQGESLQITEGAFKDQEAIFERMDGEQRAQLLLRILGRETRISLPVEQVERKK